MENYRKKGSLTKEKAMATKKFKSSEVLAVAMSLLVEGSHPAKTCCSAIGKAVRQLTGDPKQKGFKNTMPKHPLYRAAIAYLEPFRPTAKEVGEYGGGKVRKGTWWRTPSHPKVYAHKTERLIALSWAFLEAKKAKD